MDNPFLRSASKHLDELLPILSDVLPEDITCEFNDYLIKGDYRGALESICVMNIGNWFMLDHDLRSRVRVMCKWSALSRITEIIPDIEKVLSGDELTRFNALMAEGEYESAFNVISPLCHNKNVPDHIRGEIRRCVMDIHCSVLEDSLQYLLGRVPDGILQRDVAEFIDADELELAFESLIYIINQRSIPIPRKIYDKLSLFANGTPENEDWLDKILPLVQRESPKENP